MRQIGFSTGSLALNDFRRGLGILNRQRIGLVELSALRQVELVPLLDALGEIDLTSFSYVSVHAPSQVNPNDEHEVVERLRGLLSRCWPIIVHPDAISRFERWATLGASLCIENMDKRKPIGRTARELQVVFDRCPEASLCFDIGHARQVDPTMNEAARILRTFENRLRQVHISEVNSQSRHDRLTFGAIQAFRKVSHLIPEGVPIVIESRVSEDDIPTEVSNAKRALTCAPKTDASLAVGGCAGLAVGD